MQLSVDQRDSVHIVRVREPRMTYPLLAAFLGQVRRLVEDGARLLIVDLREVSYVDSATIGCLLDIHRLVQEHSGTLRLAALQPRVETMLSMTGVHKIVALHATEEEALAAFAGDDSRA